MSKFISIEEAVSKVKDGYDHHGRRIPRKRNP